MQKEIDQRAPLEFTGDGENVVQADNNRPLPEAEIGELNLSNKKNQITAEEQMGNFSRAFFDFINTVKSLREDEGLSDELLVAKKWLPHAYQYFFKNRNQLNCNFYSKKGLSDLSVVVSEMRFGFDKTHKNKDAFLKSEFLSYSLQKLEYILETYFGVDLKEIKSYTSSTEIELVEPPQVESAEMAREKIGKNLEEERKKKNAPLRNKKWYIQILKKVETSVTKTISTALAIPLAAFSGASRTVLYILEKIVPSYFWQKVWKKMLQPNQVWQLPGFAPSFIDRFSPEIAQITTRGIGDRYGTNNLRHSSSTMTNFFLQMNSHDIYDPKSDSFIGGDNISKREKLVVYDGDHQTDLPNWERVVGEREEIQLEIFHIYPKSMVDEQLMMPMPEVGGGTKTVPLSVTFIDKNGEEFLLSVYYDEKGKLFIQFTEELLSKSGELKINFFNYSPDKNGERGGVVSLPLDGFMRRNKKFWDIRNGQNNIDQAAATAELNLGEKIEQMIPLWASLSTTREKVGEVINYLREIFVYSKGALTTALVMLSPGNNNLEKIAACKQGNCFDVNRLAYVIFSRLGIKVDFLTGFASPDNYTTKKGGKVYFDYGLDDLSEGDTVGFGAKKTRKPRRVFEQGEKEFEKIKVGFAHASIRYFDPKEGGWNLVDATPNPEDSFMSKMEDRMWRRKEEKIRAESNRMDEQYGFMPFEAWNKRKNDLEKNVSNVYYWTQDNYGENIKSRRVKRDVGGGDSEVALEEPIVPILHFVSKFGGDSGIPFFSSDPIGLRLNHSKAAYPLVRKLEHMQMIFCEEIYKILQEKIGDVVGPLRQLVAEKVKWLNVGSPKVVEMLKQFNVKFYLNETLPVRQNKVVEALMQFLIESYVGGLDLSSLPIDNQVGADGKFLIAGQLYTIEQSKKMFAEKADEWATEAKKEVEVLVQALKDSRIINRMQLQNDLDNKLFGKTIEEKLPPLEELYLKWMIGEIAAVVGKNAEGKKALFITDPETGKKYEILENVENEEK